VNVQLLPADQDGDVRGKPARDGQLVLDLQLDVIGHPFPPMLCAVRANTPR
jgi:hypothetical protein